MSLERGFEYTEVVDPRVWEERWQSLDKTLDHYCSWLETLDESMPRLRTLMCLVRRLRAFAKGQFFYFYDGFGFGKQKGHRLSEEGGPAYPPDSALYVVLDQVAQDFAAIQQAVSQRIWGTRSMKSTLDLAERAAWAALSPSAELDMLSQSEKEAIEKSTVLAYFHKSPNIRIIPYAEVALIGIPFSCQHVPRDFLAIPHEIGHYVFWRGGSLRKSLFEDLKEGSGLPAEELRASYWYHWVEEIFADVYGCLVSGPVIALDFQDIQLRGSLKRFVIDDGEHPVPILRPWVYLKVLQTVSGSERREDARMLASCWGGRLQKRSDRLKKRKAQLKKREGQLGESLAELRELETLIGGVQARVGQLRRPGESLPDGNMGGLKITARNGQTFEINRAVCPVLEIRTEVDQQNAQVSAQAQSAPFYPVDLVVHHVLARLQLLESSPPEWWRNYLDLLDDEFGALYGKFDSHVARSPVGGTLNELIECDNLGELWDGWKANLLKGWMEGPGKEWLDGEVKERVREARDEMDEAKAERIRADLEKEIKARLEEWAPELLWSRILRAEDWATKGPNTAWDPGGGGG